MMSNSTADKYTSEITEFTTADTGGSSGPVIKRRRVIKSCEQCRQKKLKCTKERPTCSNCIKTQRECIYVAPSDDSNIEMLDSKIIELKEQLRHLYNKRNNVTRKFKDPSYQQARTIPVMQEQQQILPTPLTTSTSPPQKSSHPTDNTMNRQYLVGSIMSATWYVKRNDPFYKSMLENCENYYSKTLPLNRISKSLSTKQSTALFEFERIRNSVSLFDLIKPHLIDYQKMLRLVSHFFESELYCIYSFLDKETFLIQLYQIYQNGQLTIRVKQVDHIFLGQLLIILRISSLSFYNGGNTFPQVNEVNEEVIPLAKLCIREIDRGLLGKNTMAFIQLSMLLNYYQIHSPEYGSNSSDYLEFSITRLLKVCLGVRFNVDPGDGHPHANLIRKIWFHLLELNYMKFINNGDPLLIHSKDSYSTKLPQFSHSDDDIEIAVIKNMHKRANAHRLIQRAYELVSDVVNPPKLERIHVLFNDILIHMSKLSLNKLMSPNAETADKISKLNRSFHLTTLLDLYCLYVGLGIPLFYNYRENQNFENSKDILVKLSKFTGSMLFLNYFIDTSQLSEKFNLQVQFGYSLHLICKILECCNKIMVIQVTVLSRICYYSTFHQTPEKSASFTNMKDIIFKNLKILLFNVGKMGEIFLFAKEIHLINMLKIIMNFGTGPHCILTKTYLKLLQHNEMLTKMTQFDEFVCSLVVENLFRLKGEEAPLYITDDGFLGELSSNDSRAIDLYFEKCTDVGMGLNLDCSFIDKLDSFLHSNEN